MNDAVTEEAGQAYRWRWFGEEANWNPGIDAQELLDEVISGEREILGFNSRDERIVDFGRVIGTDSRSGLDSQYAIVFFWGRTGFHIIPANPAIIDCVENEANMYSGCLPDEIRQDEIRQDEIRQDEIRQDEIRHMTQIALLGHIGPHMRLIVASVDKRNKFVIRLYLDKSAGALDHPVCQPDPIQSLAGIT